MRRQSPDGRSYPARWLALAAGGVAFALAAPTDAQDLLNQTSIVALPTVAAPAQYSFTLSGAGPWTVTLTDLVEPAAFQALQMALASNGALSGSPVDIDSSTHTATLAISAAGAYQLFVVGLPSATPGIGSYGVCVAANSALGNCLVQGSNTLATPTSPSSATSTLTTGFQTTMAGTYTLTLTDAAFPAALQSASAGVFGSNISMPNIPAGVPTQLPGLEANTTYQLLVAATASAPANAGLYGVTIIGPSGAAAFAQSFPVGTLSAATIVDNPSSHDLTLTLSDQDYPTALASLGSALTSGGTLLGDLTAAGSFTTPSAAPSGPIDVWTYAQAGAEPGVYQLSLSGASAIFSTTQVVNPSGSNASGSYAFAVSLGKAGTYQLVLTDFKFPVALASAPTAKVAQGGTVLTQDASGNFTAAAGQLTIFVSATPGAGGAGLFDVALEQGGAVVYDQTQAIGREFTSQTINVGSSGNYTAQLTDLAFPQAFADLALFISRGGDVAIGYVYNQGSIPPFAATPGEYVVTFIATPSATSGSSTTAPGYGVYSVDIAPAAPTLTLSASSTSVTVGTPVTLTWTSQNATSCSASGATGWTGNEPTSGSLAVAIDATATLALSCSGLGGQIAKSVSVTATPAPSSSGGGGGLDPRWLVLLAALVGVVRRRPHPLH